MSIDNDGIYEYPVLFWGFFTLSFVEQLEHIKSTLFANVSPVPSTSEGHQTRAFEFHAEFWEGASTSLMTSNGNYEKECSQLQLNSSEE